MMSRELDLPTIAPSPEPSHQLRGFLHELYPVEWIMARHIVKIANLTLTTDVQIRHCRCFQGSMSATIQAAVLVEALRG